MLAFLLLSLQLAALCSADCSAYSRQETGDIYCRQGPGGFFGPGDRVCGADGEYSNDFYKLYHLMCKGRFQKLI